MIGIGTRIYFTKIHFFLKHDRCIVELEKWKNGSNKLMSIFNRDITILLYIPKKQIK